MKLPTTFLRRFAELISVAASGPARRPTVWSAGAVILAIGLLVLARPQWLAGAWNWYHLNRDDITPLGAFAGAAVVAWAALRQAKTARLRHEEQTEADWQRRITENFSKAAEQLGNDKLEVRLGGIYTMERISRESPEDYWPVMETLTAFVRGRARWQESYETTPEALAYADKTRARPDDSGIPTDIATVLSVICRREKINHERERQMGWSFDLRGTDLRRARLAQAHLEGAILWGAHLEGANLEGAHLEGASLQGAQLKRAFLVNAQLEGASLTDSHLEGALLTNAHLEKADLQGAWLEGTDLTGAQLERAKLSEAHLEGAILTDAHFEGAILIGSHLEGAGLTGAQLKGAILDRAHLEGANLRWATGLQESQLAHTSGDASTNLPEGMARPAAWSCQQNDKGS
jgi:uncharacterized protein YjbI with pentapeptide repeats